MVVESVTRMVFGPVSEYARLDGDPPPVLTSCQACAANIGRLTSGIGTLGMGIGACVNCHSVTCGWHGHRDANVPEFICVQCDPSILAASAAFLSDAPDDSIASAARTYFRYPSVGLWLVQSVEEFIERRPGYGVSFFADLQPRFDSGRSDVPGQLVAAAIRIISVLEIPDSAAPHSLVELLRRGWPR